MSFCDHLHISRSTNTCNSWPYLSILAVRGNGTGDWRLAVICNCLLIYLYIQTLFPRRLPPPLPPTPTKLRRNSKPQLPLHMHGHYFIWQLQAATSCWFASCINLAQIVSAQQVSRWKWQTIDFGDLLRYSQNKTVTIPPVRCWNSSTSCGTDSDVKWPATGDYRFCSP